MSDQTVEDAFPAAVAGEGWALRIVYDALSPKVLGYLRSRGASEPEDLTSEVFLAVLPRLGTIDGGAPGLSALLFSVAHARLVDDLRKRSRRPPTVPYDVDTDRRSSASAEDNALEAIGTSRVERLLAGLAPDQRDVLTMRLLGDLTVEQCAAALGKAPGAVKQLQRRGLDALRRALAAEAIPLSGSASITGPS